MRKRDEVCFWACLIVLGVLGFAGGVITTLGVLYMIVG